MAVSVRNTKTSDTSYTKLVVSRVAAAVLGGYAVTYWAGAAVAKLAIEWNIFNSVDAGMFSGLVQLVVYTTAIISVCAAASMKRAWWALVACTALTLVAGAGIFLAVAVVASALPALRAARTAPVDALRTG